MKKLYLIPALIGIPIALSTYVPLAQAASTLCIPATCSVTGLQQLSQSVVSNCATKTSSCANNDSVRWESCTTCNTGYDRTARTITPTGCSNSFTYYTCTRDLGGGDDGDDGGEEGGGGGNEGGGDVTFCDGTCENCSTLMNNRWIIIVDNTGYQQMTNNSCNTATCVCSTTTQYRCNAGYYGTAQHFLGRYSGCTQCPSSGGVAGSSTAGDNATITKCYIPTTASFSDTTGTWSYSEPCYYTE